MQKIEILKVISPSDFWITERHSASFLEMIHGDLKKERENYSSNYDQNGNESYQTASNQHLIVAVNDAQTKRWLRAIVITEVTSFCESQLIKCFLIDTGETIMALKNACSRIYNTNLKRLPPLAKHCSLFGIESTYSKRFELPTNLFSFVACTNTD